MRQTGGRAVGATSTRSRPASRARRNASAVEVEPTFSLFSSIRKIGEMRICSLWRKFVEIVSPRETVEPAGQPAPTVLTVDVLGPRKPCVPAMIKGAPSAPRPPEPTQPAGRSHSCDRQRYNRHRQSNHAFEAGNMQDRTRPPAKNRRRGPQFYGHGPPRVLPQRVHLAIGPGSAVRSSRAVEPGGGRRNKKAHGSSRGLFST